MQSSRFVCEEHGWVQDRADPHARERALCIALENPPFDVSPEEAIAAVKDVLDSIGDTCPECPGFVVGFAPGAA